MSGGSRLLRKAREWARELVLALAVESRFVPVDQRWRVLRLLGYDVARCSIAPTVYFGGRRISIGEGCYINRGVFIDATAPVQIGNRVGLAPRVTIMTSSHHIGNPARRNGLAIASPVTIDDGCWVGVGVTILPGVTIGAGCVIGAGSLVTKDCEPHGVYVGSPARRIRELDHAPEQPS